MKIWTIVLGVMLGCVIVALSFAEVNEANINFSARQCTVYDETNKQTNRFTGDDFTQFEPLQAVIEKACEKTPEQIEAEKQTAIAQCDKEIAGAQARKEAIISGKSVPLYPPNTGESI